EDLGVAAEQRDHDDRQERQDEGLHDHDGNEHQRHPASCRQVCWSTATLQLQSRQSMRHGITHVTSRHWIGVTCGIWVLQFPYRKTTQQVLKFAQFWLPQWQPPGHAAPGFMEQSR